MSSLYVKSEYRNQGIGQALINELVNISRKMEIERLYLYTQTAQNYYQKLGWKLIEEKKVRDVTHYIMEMELND